MGILMAGLAPHPPVIIPEIGGERRLAATRTIKALAELAGEVKEQQPDLLITISPHGPVFTDAISILEQEVLQGDFADFGYPAVSLAAATNSGFIESIRNNSAAAGIEVISLATADLATYNYPNRLDHGVLVPLYFIRQAGLASPIVPITMGLLAYQRLYDFGLLIQQTLAEMKIKAVVIASGDLSHRLKPGAPAGFNPRGKEFDQRVLSHLEKGQYGELLKIESQLVEKAGECGLRPLIIMLGSLQGLSFRAEIKSYQGPFGVGYAVVGFYPPLN